MRMDAARTDSMNEDISLPARTAIMITIDVRRPGGTP